jgi:hypothetical protein
MSSDFSAPSETVQIDASLSARRPRLAKKVLSCLSRRLLAVNPFYWASAVLLLYGINQVSSDPRLVGAEFAQLAFNFSSMLAYELLMVVTTIWLARRGIWSDALILVALENLFVLVPFSLVSRAVFLSNGLALGMCVVASAFAAFKIWSLKRFVPQSNLPWRLLQCGLALLLVNAVLPIAFRALEGNRPASNLLWSLNVFVVLPLLAGLGIFLPAPGKQDSSQRWLPVSCFAIWLVVTGCHLAGVGFVHGFTWKISFVAPTLWVIGWTVWRRVNDFTTQIALRRSALFLPALITLLAVAHGGMFASLSSLNILIYACICLRGPKNQDAFHLLLASVIALVAALPASWISLVAPELSRAEWVAACTAAWAGLQACLSRDPRIGLFGACGCALSTGLALHNPAAIVYLPIQAGLVYLLFHSFRWQDERHTGARGLRLFAALAWVGHSLIWTQQADRSSGSVVLLFALVVLAACGVAKLLRGTWGPRWIGVAALTVLLSKPAGELARALKATSPGFLTVGMSFLLFGLGTLFACRRHRCSKGNQQPHH